MLAQDFGGAGVNALSEINIDEMIPVRDSDFIYYVTYSTDGQE